MSRAWRFTFWRIISRVGGNSSGVGRPFQHRRRRQQDRVQRGAQLVAEHGEELVLRPVGMLGVFLGRPLLLLGPTRSVMFSWAMTARTAPADSKRVARIRNQRRSPGPWHGYSISKDAARPASTSPIPAAARRPSP